MERGLLPLILRMGGNFSCLRQFGRGQDTFPDSGILVYPQLQVSQENRKTASRNLYCDHVFVTQTKKKL